MARRPVKLRSPGPKLENEPTHQQEVSIQMVERELAELHQFRPPRQLRYSIAAAAVPLKNSIEDGGVMTR